MSETIMEKSYRLQLEKTLERLDEESIDYVELLGKSIRVEGDYQWKIRELLERVDTLREALGFYAEIPGTRVVTGARARKALDETKEPDE